MDIGQIVEKIPNVVDLCKAYPETALTTYCVGVGTFLGLNMKDRVKEFYKEVKAYIK